MTRHSYKMTFLSEEGTPLFTMYNRNFDVLETRVIERMKTARIEKGVIELFKDGKRVAEGFLISNPTW